MLWRHIFDDVINTITSLSPIKAFSKFLWKTDKVNRNCRQENQKIYKPNFSLGELKKYIKKQN